MLLLSGGLATLGLSQNSAATVIGSMIIAPLGAPIVGLGGALAAAWPSEAARMLAVVVVGAATVVAVAALLGVVLPDVTPDAQILARTDPDLRDLGVAILAGSAGAYAYTKSSLSSTLVGEAIAVALVPPLATIGLMLVEQRWTLALGATTLFTANFVGITIAAAVVLLVTGFVPLPRLRERSAGMIVGLVVSSMVDGAIAVPLSVAYAKAMSATGTQSDEYRQVNATIGVGNTAADVLDIDVNGNVVTIDVSNPDAAPTPAEFRVDLVDEIGPGVSVTGNRSDGSAQASGLQSQRTHHGNVGGWRIRTVGGRVGTTVAGRGSQREQHRLVARVAGTFEPMDLLDLDL